uniref:Uncharacterized protein n=1 Tax=Cacopsylla melanoneura TaxID=428564 RepID=A0A8D8YRU2_9HEMI
MNLFMLDSLQIWQKKNFFGFFPISFLRFGWFSWSNDPLFFFLFCSGSFRRVLLGSCSESSDSESNVLSNEQSVSIFSLSAAGGSVFWCRCGGSYSGSASES